MMSKKEDEVKENGKMEILPRIARKYFPFFHTPPQELKDWALMDNAGGSQTLKTVAHQANRSDYLFHTNVQLGASYEVSMWSARRVNEGVKAVATLINARSEKEVCLGPSTTQLLSTLAESIEPLLIEKQDEIIVTNVDHESNVGPWIRLAKRKNLILKEWKINPRTFQLELDKLDELLSPNTKLVCMTHCSNLLGVIYPVKDILKMIRTKTKEGKLLLDGVSYAPHRQVDVQDLDVDFYVFSFYKVYGPHCAVLYGKKDHFLKLKGINHHFIEEEDIPYKFQRGGHNYELTYSLGGILDYFCDLASQILGTVETKPPQLELLKIAFNEIAKHEEKLNERLLTYLSSKKNVTIIGSSEFSSSIRVPTISFVVKNMDSEEIVQLVEKHKIGIRFGHFYAKRMVDFLGLGKGGDKTEELGGRGKGVVRVSLVHYNLLEEVDRLIKTLDEIIG